MAQDVTSDVDSSVDQIIESVLLVDEFDEETKLGPEGLGAESIDVVEVAEMIDDDVGVWIPDEDLEDLETVGDLKGYVAERYES